ncbi:MAG: hypothetical protein DRN12_03500 [Thermoplasmata archaeon]|nr:MAG: hypothetical protein DRN12_03500 [Thermoplasmata archaeon]
MVEIEDIKKIFSEELELIKDDVLRRKVIEVWLEASKQGRWRSLREIPFTLLFENSGKLVDHTKRVTKLARAVMEQREEEINQDILIAGALLHDVGKLLEYTIEEGKVVKSEYGKRFRHPVSGSLLAKKMGLSDEIVHIIYAHSHEGDDTKRSIEAYIVHHCDFIDFHIRKIQVEP